MEYEKPPTATAFPRKLRSRSHSLSFSGNVIYDGVFASPAVKKSQPLLDYGEIFRGSGPSSSIPFLDVPELKHERLTVDVRSSKLDYSSVFGGFEGCDFAVSPEELIIKSKKERAGKDEGNPGKAGKPHVPSPSKAKNQIAASPEAVGMKQFNMSYNQTNLSIENGMNGITQIAKVHALSGYAKVVNDTCALQKMESRTLVSSVKKEPCNGGPTEVTRPMSSVKLEPCNGASTEVTRPISSVKMEPCNGGPKEVATPVSSVKIETCNGTPAEVTDCNRAGVDVPCSNSASKCSSKTEYEFQNMFAKNGCNIGDISADNSCEIDCNAKQPDVTPPSSFQQSSNHNKDASDRSMSSKPGISETFDAPCSPPYFDEETDANSAAAVSAAAVKKAIEEAQLRIKIAKQMMERKKEGRSRVKSRSYDCLKIEDKGNGKDEREAQGHKEDKGNGKDEREPEGHKEDKGNGKDEREIEKHGEDKGNRNDEREIEKHGEDKGNGRDGRGTEKHGEDKGNEKDERETAKHREDKGNWKDEREKEESRDDENQDSGDLENSLRQVFPKEGDHHLKRARKQWEVPGELLKSNLDHKQEEAEKHEVVNPGEEHARRARKHWEIPGGIFKSVADSKQDDTENVALAKLDTHANRDMQPVAENSFYTFGHLGNKIKSVVEAFTGSKVEQKNGAEGADFGIKDSLDDFKLSHEVLIQEDTKKARLVEPKEKFVIPSETEKYGREVGEVLKSTECTSETQIDNSAEPGMCLLVEECSQKEEKEMGWCGQAKNASELENAPMGNEITSKTPRRRRFWKTSEDVYEMIRFPKGYKRACLLEDDKEEKVKRCLGEDSLRVNDTSNSEATDETSELPSDSGLQENWNVLKQMFRQMFQTVDTGREGETCGQVDTEQMHAEIDQRAEAEDRKGLAESPIYQLTGADKCDDTSSEQNGVRSVGLEFQAHVHTRENEDSKLTLETYHQEEHGTIMEQTEASLVYDLTRKEPEAVEEASNQEEEVVAEVSEASGLAQGAVELDECKEHGDNLAKTVQRDQGEMGSSNSVEKCEENPCEELAEETTIDSSMESDEGEPSFELRQGDSDIEEVELEQKLSDQCPENSSTAGSTGEHVEEVDSESNKSGFDVEGMELIIEREVHEDNFESYLEEDSADYVEGAGASQPPCELEEDCEIGEESQGSESNEDNSKQECDVECPPEDEFDIRKDAEAAELPSRLSKGDEEMDAVLNTNKEALCRSLTEEKREVTADASQKEAEPVQEHLEKTDEAKEKEKEREKERVMVERAIREARERAFAEARERAERAATGKANAGAQQHRAATTKARVKPEKPSMEVNDKSSLTEKATMQAKVRAERAAVERALAEARERALEKALSAKAASQARSRGNKPSFSSSGTHNRGSGPFKSYTDTNSSNQSANGEPVQRCQARSERHQRTVERAAKALAEKKLRDIIAQKEQTERNRFADTVAAEVKRWSSGKEGNLRALLSTLQYILGPESGWKPIPLTELVSNAAVRKAYRKATLYVHPDKLQQRGAGTQRKYTCEKVFDLLQEAWNKFSAEER